MQDRVSFWILFPSPEKTLGKDILRVITNYYHLTPPPPGGRPPAKILGLFLGSLPGSLICMVIIRGNFLNAFFLISCIQPPCMTNWDHCIFLKKINIHAYISRNISNNIQLLQTNQCNLIFTFVFVRSVTWGTQVNYE